MVQNSIDVLKSLQSETDKIKADLEKAWTLPIYSGCSGAGKSSVWEGERSKCKREDCRGAI